MEEKKKYETTVIMVELKVPMEDTPDVTFFGSKKAIFEYFGNKVLGISYGSLRTHNIKDTPYENKTCRIIKGTLWKVNSAAIIARREKEGRQALPTEKVNFNNN